MTQKAISRGGVRPKRQSFSLRNLRRLQKIVARLRGPGGCPWDREQTHESIRHDLIEECYETVEGLDAFVRSARRAGRNRPDRQAAAAAFCEELGDLLLQVMFHAQIAAETGDFDFDGVARATVEKLIRRHPHVFGRDKLQSTAQVLRQWETIKRQEKNSASILGQLPRHLPALLKADKVQRKVARVGFDWEDVADVVAKVEEEVRELKDARASGDRRQFAEELGDLLFAVVNVARFEKLQAEDLLNRGIAKFVKRFQQVEQAVHRRGGRLEDCSPVELNALWEATKKGKRRGKRGS